jgi:6-pyruvoyltetrahydropterin/6-carboxytetrahydropterin synthase
MYIASIQTTFSAAHCIKGYKGDCAKPHGHNYRVEIHVASPVVNDTGMSVDFRKLREIASEVVGELDHTMLNELPFFSKNNPTAENIARYVYEKVKSLLPEHLTLSCIRIWETDESMVEYHE